MTLSAEDDAVLRAKRAAVASADEARHAAALDYYQTLLDLADRYTYAEIAESLDVVPQRVGQLVQQARQALPPR